jgi:hypothetical protein
MIWLIFYSDGTKTRKYSVVIVFNFALEYTIMTVQENQKEKELSRHQLQVSADYVNLSGKT